MIGSLYPHNRHQTFLVSAFGFTPVGAAEYGIALCLAILVIPVVEAVKFFQRCCRRQGWSVTRTVFYNSSYRSIWLRCEKLNSRERCHAWDRRMPFSKRRQNE